MLVVLLGNFFKCLLQESGLGKETLQGRVEIIFELIFDTRYSNIIVQVFYINPIITWIQFKL